MWTSLRPYLADILLGLFLVWHIYLGYTRGLVQTIGQFMGAIGGFWIAKTWALPISHIVESFVPFNLGLIQIVVFVLIFFVADRLVGFIFWMID